MADKLLSCPFCGSPAEFKQIPHDEDEPNAGGEYIECTKLACRATTHLMFAIHDDVKPLLAEIWNRRAPALPAPATLDIPDFLRNQENLKREWTLVAADPVPCRHEWYQGACAHCALDANEYQATRKQRNTPATVSVPVFFYEREFYPLSNFSAFRIDWKGMTFDTSEAAYHWEKFPDAPGLRAAIHQTRSAHSAFKCAEQFKASRRPDWDAVKIGIMRDILRAKADQHEYVRRKLLETGERELIEDSWRDDFWGWGPNKDGQNMLGKLWMEVRAMLAAREKGE